MHILYSILRLKTSTCDLHIDKLYKNLKIQGECATIIYYTSSSVYAHEALSKVIKIL